MTIPVLQLPPQDTDSGRRAATAVIVADRATGTADARQLWDALGLDREDLTAGLASIRARRMPAGADTTCEENPNVDAYTAVARSMADDGHSTSRIAAELGLAEDEVGRIVSGEQDQVGADTVTQEPTLVVTDASVIPAGTPETIPQSVPGVDQLLAWADTHGDPVVRAGSAQARTLLADLAGRRDSDARERELSAVVADLETRLCAARAELETLRPAPAKKPARRLDYDPKTVRAWAANNGYQVAPQGLVAKNVVDAWRAANQAPTLRAAS